MKQRTLFLKVLSILFLMGICFKPMIGAASEFYFSEKDGKNRVIAYKADCNEYSGKPECSLTAISLGNSKSVFRCSMTVERLMISEEAIKNGDIWIVSTTAGACGYTNTYQFSKGGMVQIKSSPRTTKSELCQVFEPKTYKMTAHNLFTEIKFNTEGCKTIGMAGFQ